MLACYVLPERAPQERAWVSAEIVLPAARWSRESRPAQERANDRLGRRKRRWRLPLPPALTPRRLVLASKADWQPQAIQKPAKLVLFCAVAAGFQSRQSTLASWDPVAGIGARCCEMVLESIPADSDRRAAIPRRSQFFA